MKKGGYFFVCGDVGMVLDVMIILFKIIQEYGKMILEQVQLYFLKLWVKLFIEFKIRILKLFIFFIFFILFCDFFGNMILEIKIFLICIVYVYYFIGI